MSAIEILVVEDEGLVAEDIKQTLESLGYVVPVVVASGEAAVSAAAENCPDLVLMDIVLKGRMDGIQAAEQIAEHFDIPIVYLTAYADDETLQRARIVEPFGFVTKPFQQRELHCVIQLAIQKCRLERAVRESEQHFRSLIEHASELIVILDRDHTITYASPSHERVLWYRPDDLIGQQFLRLVHPDDVETTGRHFAEVISRNFVQTAEFRVRHKSGCWRILEAVTNNRLGDPAVAGIVINARDITPRKETETELAGYRERLEILVKERTRELADANESLKREIAQRKQAEEVLHRSEQRFRSLVETTSDWIWEVDQNWVYTYSSPKCKELLGYEPDEIIGKSPGDFMLPDDARRTDSVVRTVAESRAPILRLVNANQHKNGRQVILETSGVPVLDSNGELLGYRGIDRDITAQKKAEQSLRETERRYGRLLAAVTTYTYTVEIQEGETITTQHGPGCKAVTGYDPEDYIADPHLWIHMVYPDDRQTVQQYVAKILASEDVPHIEHRILQRDKSLRWVRNTIVRHTGDNGELVRYDGLIEDITDKKRAEEALRIHKIQLLAAQKIQERLLPDTTPELPGFDIAGRLYPAEFAAGDFFDFLAMRGDSMGFAIGDVTGHGFAPALIMAFTHVLLRLLTQAHSDVVQIMTLANAALVNEIEDERFVTLLLGRLDPDSRSFVYASAGHSTGYVFDAAGQLKYRLVSTGLPLTVLPDAEYELGGPIPLESGDLVLLLTDGIEEVVSITDEQFGSKRAVELVQANRHSSAAEIIDTLYQAVCDYSRHEKPNDDVTVMVIKAVF